MKTLFSIFLSIWAFMPMTASAQDTPPPEYTMPAPMMANGGIPQIYDDMTQHHQAMHGNNELMPMMNNGWQNDSDWGNKKSYIKDHFMDLSGPMAIITMIGMLVIHAILWLVFLIVSVFVARKVWDFAGKKKTQ